MNSPINHKKILIAPLNWGLGHATRCIPVIRSLQCNGIVPILAADGDALKLLQQEFPKLKSYKLPAYDIQYAKKGRQLKWKLFFQVPKILWAVQKEKKLVQAIVEKEDISGIISDNRPGVRSNKVPTVYITHQVNVLSGSTTFFTKKLHQQIISKFDECWVPDYQEAFNLAGELSHCGNTRLNLKYIGPLSRFAKKRPSTTGKEAKKYDIMVLLSGLEPQRTILEKKLLKVLKPSPEKILFVRGLMKEQEETSPYISRHNGGHIKMVNFLKPKELEEAILTSAFIISRPGYSTIMDLERLHAKAFFIPTPGQFEQEYLAEHMEQQKIAPYEDQEFLELKSLDKINDYSGFETKKTSKEKGFPLDVFYRS